MRKLWIIIRHPCMYILSVADCKPGYDILTRPHCDNNIEYFLFFRSVKFTILIWRFFMRWTCVRPLLKSKYTTEPHLNTINCNTYNAQQKAMVWLRQYFQAHTKKIIQINKNRNERSKYRKTNPVGKKMNTKLGHWLLMANDGCSHEV